tara:strand:+ start:502 stop:714 length:213 start_codon:yes stop_codon:yes gene_type:complete
MTVQATFLPKEEFIASKTAEERIAYVKANPLKYANKPQYDHNKNMEDKINLIKNTIEALDSKVNQILAKK